MANSLFDIDRSRTRGHNNVWGNWQDYGNAGTVPDSHLASDPLYVDPDNGDWRLADTSPSKTAAANGGEIGRYGGIFLAVPPTLDPVTSPVAATEQVMTGTKAAGTGVGINGSLLVPIDETTLWSATVPLAEGLNNVAVYGIDALGQRSAVIPASIRRDTSPPAIIASSPQDGAALNALIDEIRLTLADAGTEVDFDAAIAGATVQGSQLGAISGSWSQQGDALLFAADALLLPDTYTIDLPLKDQPLGNEGQGQIRFSIQDNDEDIGECFAGTRRLENLILNSGSRIFRSEVGLDVAGTVAVGAGASLDLTAPSITLEPGFRVASGGVFKATSGAVTCPGESTVRADRSRSVDAIDSSEALLQAPQLSTGVNGLPVAIQAQLAALGIDLEAVVSTLLDAEGYLAYP